MVDINDVDFKLLKMNESLLDKIDDETLINNTLANYRTLAIKIDRTNYNELVDQVNNYNRNHNQSFEEEITALEHLEVTYNQLYEMQCRFRNIYNVYASNDELELADLTRIRIELIRERKDAIGGYLINVKNINECKNKIEEYNKQLIIEEKKRNYNCEKFQKIEEELKEIFFKAEGRVNATEKYTSIIAEYKKNNFDLKKLFEDSNLMDMVFKEVSEQRKEKEEVLKIGKICYDKVPNSENKEVLESLRVDAIRARYHLSLIKIAQFIVNCEDSYDKLIEKREQLLDLIKMRVSYLNYLGTNFVIDPFSRIKIREQIDYIDTSLEDNSRVISRIRKMISDLNDSLEKFLDKRNELLRIINFSDKEFIRDTTKFNDIDLSIVNLGVNDSLNDDKLNKKEKIYDNEVIESKNISADFKLDRVREKSTGVIKRVNELINFHVDKSVSEQKQSDLVVEEVKSFNKSDELDSFTMPIGEIFPSQSEVIQEEDNSNELFEDSLSPTFMIDNIDNNIASEDEHLFEDNIDSPFGGIQFFDERRNDIETKKENMYNVMPSEERIDLESSNIDNEEKGTESVIMPEAFWEIKQPDSEKIESLDEQIKKLKLVS